MPTYLIPEDRTHRPVLMDRAVLFFGRHPDCDVIITCSRKVSRKHCCVAQIDDYFVVRDLGSMNGVRVNGKPGGREHVLRVGDRLLVGDVPFLVETGRYELPKGKLVIGPTPGVNERPPQASGAASEASAKAIAKQSPSAAQPAQPKSPQRANRPAPPPVPVAAEQPSDADQAIDPFADQPPAHEPTPSQESKKDAAISEAFAAGGDQAPMRSMEVLLDEDDVVDDSFGSSEVLDAIPISDDEIDAMSSDAVVPLAIDDEDSDELIILDD